MMAGFCLADDMFLREHFSVGRAVKANPEAEGYAVEQVEGEVSIRIEFQIFTQGMEGKGRDKCRQG